MRTISTRHRRPTWLATIGLFGTFSLSVLPAAAQSTTVSTALQLVVVLDGSGSMWAKMPGALNSKVDTLRTGLGDIIRRRAPRVPVGLVTFGARSGNSCASTNTVLLPRPGQADQFDAALAKFNPKGRGPVVLGLDAAVNAVGNIKGPVRLLLIHDSPDNCRQDACGFARNLARTQPRIAIDVVSLGLKRSQLGAMSCVTKATGGQLIEAASMTAALDGLDRLISSVGKATPAVLKKQPETPKRPEENKAPPPLKSAGVTVSAILAASKKPIDGGITWQVVSKSPIEPSFSKTVRQPVLDLALAPGTYSVTMRTELAELTKDIVVRPGPRQPVVFEFDGGLVAVQVIGADNRSIRDNTLVSVTRADGSAAAATTAVWSGPARDARALLLPDGTYRVSVGNGLNLVSRTFDTRGGARHAIAYGTQTARLNVTATGLQDTQVEAAQISIAVDDAKQPNGRRTIARTSSLKASFDLPAGAYYVTLRAFNAERTSLVILAAGETLSSSIALPQMALRVTSHVGDNDELAGSGIRYRVWRANQLNKPIAVSRKARPVFHLAPGKYRIESRIGLQNAVMIRDFDVGPGATGNLELRHRAGRIDFEPPATVNATGRQIIYWELLDDEGRVIWQSFEPTPSATLAAGTYTVRMSSKGRQYSTKLIVVAGQIQSVTPVGN